MDRVNVQRVMAAPIGVSIDRPPERIAVGELMLARWRPDDLDALFAAVSSTLEHLRPWMGWAAHHDRESIAQFLAESDDGWERGERFEYAIRDQRRGVLGSAGLLARIGAGGLEIGFWVHAAHTRQRVATRAVAALTEAALALSWVTHVEIHHDEANTASGAIPSRLGFRIVGTYSQEPAAPAEKGREVRWRLDADELPTSAVQYWRSRTA
jgi:ribosomal-protein-serine acetyltransferase